MRKRKANSNIRFRNKIFFGVIIGDYIIVEMGCIQKTDGPGILVKSYYEKALGTTIDMKSEKVLHLEDIIIDFDGLSELLMEDKFEAIEIWAGEEPDKLSVCFQGKDKNTFIEELQTYGSGYIENVEWYTDGSAVVIIYGNLTERYYGEYSGSKEMLVGITDPRFWKKMN